MWTTSRVNVRRIVVLKKAPFFRKHVSMTESVNPSLFMEQFFIAQNCQITFGFLAKIPSNIPTSCILYPVSKDFVQVIIVTTWQLLKYIFHGLIDWNRLKLQLHKQNECKVHCPIVSPQSQSHRCKRSHTAKTARAHELKEIKRIEARKFHVFNLEIFFSISNSKFQFDFSWFPF